MMPSQKHALPLLSLPQLPLEAVIKCLSRHDRRNLAAVCRSLATAVSVASQNSKMTVTSKTGWKGLSKVLATGTIECRAMLISGKVKKKRQLDAKSAFDMLMLPTAVPQCCFYGIQKVFIEAAPLPCLLPPPLACTLPNLQELSIDCHADQFADAQPLPYCSTLQKLSYTAWRGVLHLPNKYHTAEDLQRQLPNVNSLHLKALKYPETRMAEHLGCVNNMLHAWGGQLTSLALCTTRTKECTVPATAVHLQHCTRLQSLYWSVGWKQLSLFDLPASLVELKLSGDVTEFHLQIILNLPTLRTLDIDGSVSSGLQQDWSKHPCSLQQFTIYSMPLVDLAKFPLHSLKGKGCLKISSLDLPNPLLVHSLAKVEHAVRCVRDAGIMIERVMRVECELWDLKPVCPASDAASCQLVNAASGILQMGTTFLPNSNVISYYPLTTAALFRCFTQYVHSIGGGHAHIQPWFWKALQRSCCSLKHITLAFSCLDVETANSVVLQASELLIAVTHRPLSLSLICTGDKRHVQAETEELGSQLQQKLPASVLLQKCYLNYDDRWEFTLQPVL